MPQAVTHILLPIIAFAIFRDFYLKRNDKKKFPLHYVLIAGLGGVLPDIDFIISLFLNLAGSSNWYIHKTFFHSLLFPASTLILFFILRPINIKAKVCNIGKHNLRLSTIFLILTIGILIHFLLDALVGNMSYWFYPFSDHDFGLNLISIVSKDFQSFFMPLLDGILLVIWILYLELKHKISDFI